MTKHLSDYIVKKASEAYGHKLYIRNETSRTQFTKTDEVILKELREQGVTLELPHNICQKGHTLTLFFLDLDTKPKLTLPMTGSFSESAYEVVAKVEEIELNNCNKDSVYVVLHFTQYNTALWKHILEQYLKNQGDINELLMNQRQRLEKP